MAYMKRKEDHDWCHCCGQRTAPFVEVWYPHNAEYDALNEQPSPGTVGDGPERSRFLRVCAGCVRNFGQVVGGEVESLAVDRRERHGKRPRRGDRASGVQAGMN